MRLAPRPERSAPTGMPPTARPAPRGERRGLLDLIAGPVPYLYGVAQRGGGLVPI
jgi:hypothetical protein